MDTNGLLGVDQTADSVLNHINMALKLANLCLTVKREQKLATEMVLTRCHLN